MRRSMAVFCWLVVFPLAASALGLGDISLNSALNQPFSAEIPVESYADSDLKGLKVALASKETFDRYGLDSPAFLQGFEFRVAENKAGMPVLRISSTQPVAEPFVTLLLDIRWSSGRLLREYTVLLDPPLFESEPVQTVVAAPATTTTADAVTETTGSSGQVIREPAPMTAPVTSTAPAQNSVAPARSAPAQKNAAASPALSGSYSVQRRDTLWSIANRVRGDRDLTVNQVMLALYRANPEAFLGNINRLKAGAILRVPEQARLAELSPGEATAAVREQNQALAQPAPAAAAEPARLTLVAPAEEAATATTPADDVTGAGAEQALGAAARSVEAQRLTGRISELEAELSSSKRLLEARDSELAALQRRVQALESGDQAASSDTGVDQSASESAADELIADDGVFVDEGATADSAAGAVESAAQPDVDQAPEQVAGDAVAPSVPDTATTVPARTEEPSFIGQLLSNLWFWISAAVVLLLALFVARRRKAGADEDFDADATGGGWETAAADADHEETMRDLEALEEPDGEIVVEEAAADEAAQATQEATSEGTAALENLLDFGAEDGAADATADAGKTAQLSPVDDATDKETPLEKTISTGPLNLDQADPVAEAEFHMAYGLYDQAAELLESALQTEPDNRGYLVKLIEVFFVWENREGFLKHAQALHEAIDDDSDSDWNKVVILGKQLCPDEALFSGAAAASPASDSMDLELSDAGDTELDFTLGGTDVPALSEDAFLSDDGAADADLDFDLGGDFAEGGETDLELNPGDEVEGADTLETPTIESPAVDHGEADDESGLDLDLGEELIDDSAATMETPTIESPMNEPTLESPTLETAGAEGETTEMPALDEDAFDAGEVDLDLGGADDLDVDLSGLSDFDEEDNADTAELPTDDKAEVGDEISAGLDDEDATLLADISDEVGEEDETLVADSADLESEIEAELDAQADEGGSDTVEQPKIDSEDVELGDTAEQPAMVDTGSVDFDLGAEAEADDDVATAIQEASLPEDATMTEVGTKLDLARAYIDMGDPDGARSILNEVLEEGAAEQQQEARQLLEELGD